MPIGMSGTLNPFENASSGRSINRAGLIFTLAGCIVLIGAGAIEMADPFFALVPPRPWYIVPLIILVAGSFLIRPPVAASGTARHNVLCVKVLALGNLFLTPFAPWATYASRSLYLTICAFLGMLCFALWLRQLCEHCRQLLVVGRMHRPAVYAYRIKQVVHFLVVIPTAFAAVAVSFRQATYGVKAFHLLGFVWSSSSNAFRIITVTVIGGALIAALALIASTAYCAGSVQRPKHPKVEGETWAKKHN